jgi:glutathione S-transferase
MEAIRDQVAVLDRHLDGRDHVLLDRRNLLDPYVFAMARWCEDKLDYARAFPHVARFLDRMREDPGVLTALAIDAGEVDAHGALLGHVAWSDAIGTDGALRPDLDS